jgi:hypothetical protein
MTGNRDPEKPPEDIERRHDKAREFLIDALSLAMGTLAVFHYEPKGTLAGVIAFAGGYVIAKLLVELLWSCSGALLGVLSVLIYMATLVMALSSLPAMLLSALLPGIAQAYWIWALWPATGSLFHPLTLSCVAWLILLGITIFKRNLFATLFGRAR